MFSFVAVIGYVPFRGVIGSIGHLAQLLHVASAVYEGQSNGNPPETRGRGSRGFSARMHEEVLMKMTRYSETQVFVILRQAKGVARVPELCCAVPRG